MMWVRRYHWPFRTFVRKYRQGAGDLVLKPGKFSRKPNVAYLLVKCQCGEAYPSATTFVGVGIRELIILLRPMMYDALSWRWGSIFWPNWMVPERVTPLVGFICETWYHCCDRKVWKEVKERGYTSHQKCRCLWLQHGVEFTIPGTGRQRLLAAWMAKDHLIRRRESFEKICSEIRKSQFNYNQGRAKKNFAFFYLPSFRYLFQNLMRVRENSIFTSTNKGLVLFH